MSNFDIILIAYKNILKNKIKFSLTMISILIGIISVVVISTISDIATQIINKEFTSMGIDGLAISTKYSNSTNYINVNLAENIEENFLEIEQAMPVLTKFGSYETSTKTGQALILGVDESLYETLRINSLFGECFTKNDVNLQKNYCVIDETLAQKLYSRSNIIGKEIFLSISGKIVKFEIIGIISSQTELISSFSNGYSPSLIYIPYTIVQNLTNTQEISQIAIRSQDNTDLEELKLDLENFLSRKTDNNFEIQNISAYMDTINDITYYISLVLTCVGSISLVVATIGVTNMMFSSALERKKEIGIYMALGAKPSVISKIFLTESIFICLFSGALGVIIGLIAVFFIAYSLEIDFYVNFRYIYIIFILSILSGIISGIAPAIKASLLNPIDVLRD